MKYNSVKYMEFISRTFRLHRINLKQPLLLVQGKLGYLGSGHLDMGICEENGDAIAIVKPVKTFNEILFTEVVDVTSEGERLGINIGMKGEDALKRICMPWELRD